MLTLGVAIFLSMAASAGDPVDDARKAFNNCLITAHNEAIKAKTSLSSFRKSTEDMCTAEKTSYYNTITKNDMASGSSASEAKEYAQEEVTMMIEGIKSAYAENIDANATLTLEK